MVAENTALSSTDYVPILKCRMSELGAAEKCTARGVVPLFEVVDPGDRSAASISNAWPAGKGVVWLHSLNLEGRQAADFAGSIDSLFTSLRTSVVGVPVVTADEEAATLKVVREIVATDQRGVVLRVDASDLIDPGASGVSYINSTLEACEVAADQVDLVLDAGLIRDQQPAITAAVVEQALRVLPSVGSWRTVVVALSAFPAEVYKIVPTESVGTVPRNDASAFAVLRKLYTERQVAYGDYTIGTPEYIDAPYAPVPSIKYAADLSWKVHRAATKRGPGPQYRQLAADVAAASYFLGRGFSYGDAYIDGVASGVLDGPGNATTYLRAGISHHVQVVTNRLATLGVP